MNYSLITITHPLQDIDELLDPFDESIDVEPYINITRQDVIQETKEVFLWQAKDIYKALNKKPDKEIKLVLLFPNCVSDHCGSEEKIKKVVDSKDLEETLRIANLDDEEHIKMAKEFFYIPECFDDNDNLLTTYNPQSKWYSYGPSQKIPTKSGQKVHRTKISDVDLETIRQYDYDYAKKRYEKYERGELEQFASSTITKYGIDFGSADEYAQYVCPLISDCVLTGDGVWWGSEKHPVSKEKLFDILKDTPPHYIITYIILSI